MQSEGRHRVPGDHSPLRRDRRAIVKDLHALAAQNSKHGFTTEQPWLHHRATESKSGMSLSIRCSLMKPAGHWRTKSRLHQRAPYRYLPYATQPRERAAAALTTPSRKRATGKLLLCTLQSLENRRWRKEPPFEQETIIRKTKG
jgi:hypothetical protein